MCGGAIAPGAPPAGPGSPAQAPPPGNPPRDEEPQSPPAADEGRQATTQADRAETAAARAPVWAEGVDDLVAPAGLVGDDDEPEEDGDEARRESPSAAASPDTTRPDETKPDDPLAKTEVPAAAATKPGLLAPAALLALVLAIQAGAAFWAKSQEGMAALAPVLGFAGVLVLALAALFLLGRGGLSKIGLRPFTSFHFLLVLFAAPAVAVIAAQVGELISGLVPEGFRPPATPAPGDDLSALALAVVGLCVVPALGLELAIRGVLGRSLIAKFGVVIGMVLTCLAFAASFVWPERIAEWFVIGVAVQIVFLATRSLGAAITLNALCAVVALLVERYPDALNIPGYTYPQITPFVPWTLLGAAGGVLASILMSLYLTRARFLTAEGAAWTPGYCSLEQPPREAEAQLVSPDAHGGMVAVIVAIFAGFLVTLFWEHQRGVVAVEAYKANRALKSQPAPTPGAGMGMPMPPMPKGVPGMGPPGMGPPGLGPPGGGKGGGGKKGKAGFGKGGQSPLAESSTEKKPRPSRPEGDGEGDGAPPKRPAPDEKAPVPAGEPKASDSPDAPKSSPPPAASVDALDADLPPARSPAS